MKVVISEFLILIRKFIENIISAEGNERIRLKNKENELALKEKHTKGLLNVSSTVHQRLDQAAALLSIQTL